VAAVKKQRLDRLLVVRGLAASRTRAQAMIMAGRVLVHRQPVLKAGTAVPSDADISLKGTDLPYVSRGGLKLAAALAATGVAVAGKTCLDVGASTGGFTDCLLQNGAARVYAVDVGYGQLAWKLRQDPRVTVIERTNIRHMPGDALPAGAIDLITIDVSFISLRLVMPKVLPFLCPDGSVLALIKPQFEVGKGAVGKGGVVRDAAQHASVVADLTAAFETIGLQRRRVVPSPIAGPKGNREFLIWLSQTRRAESPRADSLPAD
jgi:23S rRNA (cytidine1920-2'-O)/16S rRNA (cytidine1409-2'-O)-methyltransferase